MAIEKPSPGTQQQTAVIRINRGATALGTDGALGTVHQIIMDQRTGELQALVLATDGEHYRELPAIHVLRATGNAVYVDVSKEDLRLRPDLAMPYNPDRYVPVRGTPGGEPSQERPMVTTIERDAVGVIVPEATTRKAALLAPEPAPEPMPCASRTIGDDVTPVNAVPVITPGTDSAGLGASIARTLQPAGLENAATFEGTDVPIEDKEEAIFMERSEPPVNPTNPMKASDTIYDDENTVPDVLDESQHAYTHIAPPEAGQRRWDRQGLASPSGEGSGSQLSWAPAVALGALIVGIGAWSTIRAIRRGRRKAARAARNARASVRESVREAGKSAVGLAQTVRASAQEMATNPRDTATDALSNLSDIPARYRWFRRGMRVGSRAQQLNMKVRRPQ